MEYIAIILIMIFLINSVRKREITALFSQNRAVIIIK